MFSFSPYSVPFGQHNTSPQTRGHGSDVGISDLDGPNTFPTQPCDELHEDNPLAERNGKNRKRKRSMHILFFGFFRSFRLT